MTVAQDPVGDSVTIDRALATARARRPQFAAAAAATALAEARAAVAGLIPNPTFQLEADQNAPTRKALLTQPLGWLVRRGADQQSGRATITAGRADSAQQDADLTRDVRAAFYRALGARELDRLITEQLRLADSIARLMQRRLDAGDISVVERDQALQEAGRMRLGASRAGQDAAAARLALARAMGLPVDSLHPLAGPLDAALGGVNSSPRDSDEAIEQAPRVRQAIGDSVAARARARAAGLARLPMPSVVAGLEWGPFETPTNRIVGFSIPVPLFNTGGPQHAEARALAEIAATAPAEARLALHAASDEARLRRDAAAARAVFVRDTLLPTARRLRAGSMRLLEEGRTGLLPVLDAMRSERDALQALVSELVTYQTAAADYLALMGRIE